MMNPAVSCVCSKVGGEFEKYQVVSGGGRKETKEIKKEGLTYKRLHHLKYLNLQWLPQSTYQYLLDDYVIH